VASTRSEGPRKTRSSEVPPSHNPPPLPLLISAIALCAT
jgi:hypothetical protein